MARKSPKDQLNAILTTKSGSPTAGWKSGKIRPRWNSTKPKNSQTTVLKSSCWSLDEIQENTDRPKNPEPVQKPRFHPELKIFKV